MNPFACDRHLTVYKPGYALRNSKKEIIPVENAQPKDFGRSNNVVRLVKFKKAAEEWKKIAYSESDKKYPRHLNYRFLGDCFESGLKRSSISMDKVFRGYEDPFLMEEKAQKRREYEYPQATILRNFLHTKITQTLCRHMAQMARFRRLLTAPLREYS